MGLIRFILYPTYFLKLLVSSPSATQQWDLRRENSLIKSISKIKNILMITLTDEKVSMTHNYNLNPILETLNNGGSILYPTDTVWGIGCDATNADAVDKIFQLKERDRSKPFNLLVSSVEMLKNYIEHLHPRIETLLLYHVRPLTIVYEKAKNLPPISIAKDGSVGFRIPNDEFCRKLIENFGKPIVATSANISNSPLPNHFGEISSDILMQVDHVVKYRQREKNMNAPSVIAKLSDSIRAELEFLRD